MPNLHDIIYTIIIVAGLSVIYSFVEANAYSIILFLGVGGICAGVLALVHHDSGDESTLTIKGVLLAAGISGISVVLLTSSLNYLSTM